MNKQLIDNAFRGHQIQMQHPDASVRFIEGLAASGICCGVYSPDDELVFATDAFMKISRIQTLPESFDSVMRRYYDNKVSLDLEKKDFETWLTPFKQPRRQLPVRSYEVKLFTGQCFLVTETTYNHGWVLNILIDITAVKETELLMEKARDEAIMIAQTDSLTQLLNRGGIMKRLDAAIHHAQNTHEPLSIAIIDLDHFKSINDRFGHTMGDRVLKHFADCCREVLRVGDIIGRVGGEEFLLIMPKTDETAATGALDRLRNHVYNMSKQDPLGTEYTFSAGVIAWKDQGNLDELYQQADQILYHAKHLGRNRICNSDNVKSLSEVWD